jgi:hypothetical protein
MYVRGGLLVNDTYAIGQSVEQHNRPRGVGVGDA